MKCIKIRRSLILLFLCNGFAMFGPAAMQASSHAVTLSWAPSPQPENIAAVSWNIYRSTANSGPYSLLASVPVAMETYTDSAVMSGNEYFYVVTCLDAAGVESANSAPVDATVPTGDFIATFDHSAASTNPGGQASYVLNLAPSGGFDAGVTLSADGLPPGVTASFSQTVVAGGSGVSTLTLTASSTTPAGNYLVTVAGSSGTLVHSTTVTFLLGTVDYTGNITPITQAVSASAGGSAQYIVNLTDLGTKVFGSRVTLYISGLPNGVTGSFQPATVDPDVNGTSMLTLTVSSTTPPGSYTPIVTGTGGGLTHAANINLVVAP